MKLLIKNMVCRHCVDSVRSLVGEFPGLGCGEVGLGYVEVGGNADREIITAFGKRLEEEGFELIESREARMVETVKQILIERVRQKQGGKRQLPLSEVLSERLNASYSALSRMFSAVEGRTIESYMMALRTERVKELIKYEQMSLSEIAFEAGYSSVAHMSRSFKQQTGMTPGEFREMGVRKFLPEV